MTVKELIQELLEYDMESEVMVVCEIDTYEKEDFDFVVKEDHQIFGKDIVTLNFELDEPLGHKEEDE